MIKREIPVPSRRLRVTKALVAAAFGFAAGASMAQTISDVPLVVKNNVSPNFMFMIDNSGSMNNIVPGGTPYNEATNYTPSWCAAASQVIAAGTAVNIRVATTGSRAGEPWFTAGGTFRAFGDAPASGSDPRRCFNRTAMYPAKLLADIVSSGVRSPSGYLSAQYTGNFLNWYFSDANGPSAGWIDRKRLSTGLGTVKTRMEVAKSSATTVLTSALTAGTATVPASVRVGLSHYNGDTGGTLAVKIDDFTTAHRTTLTTAIAGLVPSGSTPLAETLADIGRYMATGYNGNVSAGSVTGVSIDNFLKQDDGNSCLAGVPTSCSVATDATPTPATGTPTRPIQYWCQRSYAFMLTDGRPQNDQAFTNNTYLRDYDGDCTGANAANCISGTPNWDRKKAPRTYESNGSDYLDDVSKALADVDLRPNLVAPSGQSKLGKDGRPKTSLRTYTIAFDDADARNDPLLQKTADQGGGKKIDATDEAQLVSGFKQVITDAFDNVAAAAAVGVSNPQVTGGNGSIGYASSYQAGLWYGDLVAYSVDTATGLQTGANLWELRKNIDVVAFSSRKIVSIDGSTGKAFTAGNFPSVETKTGMVDFLRGDQSREGDLAPAFRNRTSVLGDIINAEPLVVTYDGVPIIFQGANDGMLHVVDGRTESTAATRGQELWAYVPGLVHSMLPKLADQGYEHKYFVDSTPAAAEVTGVGTISRLLVGGLGKGGRGFYALNISSYEAATEAVAASKVLWEFGAGRATMGYSFGKPLIVNTAAGWRVLVTSGYDNGTSTGGDGIGRMWMLNPADGTVDKEISTGVGVDSNPAGLAHLSVLAHTAADQVVRFVYGGDLYGNVWRFDLDNASVTKIAQVTAPTGGAQPISSPLEVGPVSGSTDKVFVYVGTGRYFDEKDVPGSASATAAATQRQTMYAFVDDTSVASPTLPNVRGTNGTSCPTGGGNGNLVCQSLTYSATTKTYSATTNAVDTTSKRGWYIDWPDDTRLSNGRVLGKPTLTRGGTVALTVNVPRDERCMPGGSSWFFTLYGKTGGAIPVTQSGTDYHASVGSFLADALASRVVVIETADGSRGLIRMSDVTTLSRVIPEEKPPPWVAATWRRVYWRAVD